MLREMLIGAAAGAAGTTALNAVTYGDMLVRGRPASSTPSEAAARLADKAGIDLSARGEAPDGPTAQNRRSGLGALLGQKPACGTTLTLPPGIVSQKHPVRCSILPGRSKSLRLRAGTSI